VELNRVRRANPYSNGEHKTRNVPLRHEIGAVAPGGGGGGRGQGREWGGSGAGLSEFGSREHQSLQSRKTRKSDGTASPEAALVANPRMRGRSASLGKPAGATRRQAERGQRTRSQSLTLRDSQRQNGPH